MEILWPQYIFLLYLHTGLDGILQSPEWSNFQNNVAVFLFKQAAEKVPQVSYTAIFFVSSSSFKKMSK